MPPQHNPFAGFDYMFGNDGSNNENFPINPAKPVDNTKLYETLEISRDADPKEIKKAYKRLSRVHHPDRGGDAEKFKEINEANEILSDPAKRKIYDKCGLEGVSENDAGLFNNKRYRTPGPRKGPNIDYPLRVKLEDLYNGKTRKLAINRKVIIGETQKCDRCNGSGVIFEDRKIGGMFLQGQQTCRSCQGRGEIAETKSERKEIEVHIDKGMANHQRIRFRGLADEYPNTETGDVNIIIEEQKHSLFKRKGADLLVVREISLNQALCGWTWKFNHLDGRTIVVKTKEGEILQGERKDEVTGLPQPVVKIVKNEGMPSHGNPFIRGDLYIKFEIKFPTALNQDQICTLKSILPEPDNPDELSQEDIVEDVHMEEANPIDYGKGGGISSSNEYDSDNDQMETEPIQCQQS